MQIDDRDLVALGFQEMPLERRRDLLDAVHVELERRVGERISAVLTTQQLDEWDRLEDKGDAQEWLESHSPGYLGSDNFRGAVIKATRNGAGDVTQTALRECAQLCWLEQNAPDFRAVVQQEVGVMRRELQAVRSLLLSAD